MVSHSSSSSLLLISWEREGEGRRGARGEKGREGEGRRGERGMGRRGERGDGEKEGREGKVSRDTYM